jgi:tetratricopeptide (TPR) repeat protein
VAILELSRRADVASRALRRDWYALNARVWAADRKFARANKLVRVGEKEFGEDADFLLAAGTLGEAEARSPNPSGEPAVHAERDFRRTLTIDPMRVEARLRLGRLLQLRHDRPAALEELERSLADARSARHEFAAYMAELFLGQLHEEAGRPDAARACYEAAIAGYPSAQQAYLALGHLLVASGRVDEGWAMGRRVFGDAGQPRNPDLRPWTWYYDVTASALKASLKVMRDRVRQ